MNELNSFLAEYGYHFNANIFLRTFISINMKIPSEGVINWFESASQFIVVAYQQGKNRNDLEDLFPFLEEDVC